MDLPDESQWDETTCDLAVCQHPQCWATIRRIERGHPRILGPPCKTPLDVDDKLPVVTIVNIPGPCSQAKRRPRRRIPGLTFTKPHSLLSQGSKFDSKFQGRSQKNLPGKDLINCTKKPFKLPVLNLNETQLPCRQDVRNMVVVWIPKEPEDHVGPAEKHIVPSREGRKKRKTPTVKDKSSLVLSGKQDIEAQLGTPEIIVPPPSPVYLFEQRSSEFLPFWNQSDTLPLDLLNDLLSDEEITTPCPEMKTQLAMMKKKPPLEKSQPDSAISANMFLSVHRLTLQRPALRYPEHLKKLCYNLKIESHRKQQQQQQRTLKTPTKKQDSTERSQMDYAENYVDSFPSKQHPKLSKTESTNEDISTQIEVVSEAQERTSKDLSANTSRISWNTVLKLLRILQSTDYEDVESQLSGMQGEKSPEA
ncbi:uncharacterized protein C9orf43 homolog [Pteronotus mesoamericanus]|uniref:uncharacterized protein C9orf43 homolog n=1 Tax=Pteronotus mesoamericanus TaxID=1884717 RepID=UPI0023EB21C7|nr:uncharacterized protein C9orf43 homolog [Pteronotus parnellii mesoamericanus]